jgi:hypothetical protein
MAGPKSRDNVSNKRSDILLVNKEAQVGQDCSVLGQHQSPTAQTECVVHPETFTKMHGMFVPLLPKIARVPVEEADQEKLHCAPCHIEGMSDRTSPWPSQLCQIAFVSHHSRGSKTESSILLGTTDGSWHSSKLQRLLLTYPTERTAPWPWPQKLVQGSAGDARNEK